MTEAAKENANVGRRRLVVLVPLVVFLGLVALFLIRLYCRRSFAHSFGADRPPGAANRSAAGRRPRSQRRGRSRHRSGELQGRGDRRECLGVVVRAMPRRGAAADAACAATAALRIVGINYKDEPDNARRFLGRYGNPFAAAGADRERPRRNRMGRLWRAGNFHRRPRRPHRLQARRADHARQSRTRCSSPRSRRRWRQAPSPSLRP